MHKNDILMYLIGAINRDAINTINFVILSSSLIIRKTKIERHKKR